MIGGLGYLLAPGDAAYELNTVAAKDIWVRTPTRATAERIPTVHAEPAAAPYVAGLPAPMTPSPTRAVSSPRVLSDLFWMGRYAERAETMARLLTVTRERYHEYRYRREMEGSECVPVLLAALGQITGTDTGADGDYAEIVATAQTTLWSLTADRHRPGSLAQSVERLELGRPRGARPDVQRHLDGAGGGGARGGCIDRRIRPTRRPRATPSWRRRTT